MVTQTVETETEAPLQSIIIPRDVTLIEDGAFEGCITLKTIHVKAKIPVPLDNVRDVFKNVNMNFCKLYVPFGTKKLYETAFGWKSFKQITEE